MRTRGRFWDCSWTIQLTLNLLEHGYKRKNQRTSFPADDRQVVTITWPCKSLLGLAELFELHGELTFADFVIREDLE